MRAALFIFFACRAEEAQVLEDTPAEELDRWDALIRGLRMSLIEGGAPGRKVSVLELRDPAAPTLLTFWATYCPPCLDELPIFDELHAEGHRVVGASMHSTQPEEVSSTLGRMAIRHPNGILDETSTKAVGLRLPRGLPATIVLDRRGRARVVLGAASKLGLLAALDRARATR